jgi:hypothetical protein
MTVPHELIGWFRRTRAVPTAEEAADVGRPVPRGVLGVVEEELRAVGLRQRFRFIWSDDGSGVAEDDPHVIHIHRTLTRAAAAPARVQESAKRVLSLDIPSVARHEIGHALLFQRPADARTPEFLRLFGDVERAYRVGDPVEEVLRRMRRHGGLANPRYRRVVSLYAATHPHERFAEAVRVALAHRGSESSLLSWAASHQTAPIVTAQLLWTSHWLRSYDE